MIRQCTLDDLEAIVTHRRAMFHEMGYPDEKGYQDDDALGKMSEAFRPWLEQKMRSGEYLAWFAVDAEGAIAAGVGLWLMDWPPHMIGPGATRGNILNVYTRPESRRLGHARRLMDAVLAWCLLNGVSTVILHASEAGRPLYESMGFQPTNEMRVVLSANSSESSGV